MAVIEELAASWLRIVEMFPVDLWQIDYDRPHLRSHAADRLCDNRKDAGQHSRFIDDVAAAAQSSGSLLFLPLLHLRVRQKLQTGRRGAAIQSDDLHRKLLGPDEVFRCNGVPRRVERV